MNLVFGGITLPGSAISARYSVYADDVSTLVTNSTEIDEVGREIRSYETVTGPWLTAISRLG